MAKMMVPFSLSLYNHTSFLAPYLVGAHTGVEEVSLLLCYPWKKYGVERKDMTMGERKKKKGDEIYPSPTPKRGDGEE